MAFFDRQRKIESMRRTTPFQLIRSDNDSDEAAKDDVGRQYVAALGRGLEVLNAFTRGEASLGNREIAELTGFTRPTVSRLTFTLTRLGYLSYDERTGRYQLGLAAVALGYWGRANMYVRQIAKPLMQEASQALNLCCALGYRDGTDAVYLEHTRGARTLVLGMEPGSRTPLATTAMGRALIAAMSETERASLLGELERRDPMAWPSTLQRIETSMDVYRRSGYTVSAGEWEAEVHGVGVPLVLPGGYPPMALILGGANYQLKREEFFAQVGPYLVNLVQRIQLKLAEPVHAGQYVAGGD